MKSMWKRLQLWYLAWRHPGIWKLALAMLEHQDKLPPELRYEHIRHPSGSRPCQVPSGHDAQNDEGR